MKLSVKFILAILIIWSGLSSVSVQAATEESPLPEKKEKGSLILVPALSFVLPGLGSFLTGDYLRGASFLGYTAAGVAVMSQAQTRMDEFKKSGSLNFHHYRDLERQQQIGGAMIMHSLELSVYDSFLSRVKNYQAEGQYSFLPKEQNINSILLAPFRFEYMTRWTTFVPFAMAMLIGSSNYNRQPPPERFELRAIDGVASSYNSYVAGTGEEAMFRGWMYPVLYENTQSHWIANTTQGVLFGLAHGPTAYIQTGAGFYLGWLSVRNNYDLGESVFVHAWWDFWIIGAEVVRSRGLTRDYNLQLPPFQFSF